MTREEFELSLVGDSPSSSISEVLKALWYDRKGDWAAAHQIVQSMHSARGNKLHAYLHRKEGDNSNAAYWYARANCTPPAMNLEEEWESLLREFL
jgi:hypothetical protein